MAMAALLLLGRCLWNRKRLPGLILVTIGSLCVAWPLLPGSTRSSGHQDTLLKAMAHAYRIIDLGTLPGRPESAAASINDDGQVVGWSGIANGAKRAFLWQDGALRDLGA